MPEMPTVLSSQDRELLRRVENFVIDEPEAKLTFQRRLARENGWSFDYAAKVLQEYKRFVFLSGIAGHMVSPSEDVDQAWHLHLTYSVSYWKRLCGEVLGRELHHFPSTGKEEHQQKLFECYQKTLKSYEQVFGHKPPEDIWPEAEVRFAAAGQGRWINKRNYWLIPRISFRRTRTFALLCLGLLLMGIGCRQGNQIVWNPLDFQGPTFLGFYALCIFGGTCICLVLRYANPFSDQTSMNSSRKDISDELMQDPYAVACLSGGPRLAVFTALSALVQKKAIRVVNVPKRSFFSTKKAAFFPGESLGSDAPPLEKTIQGVLAPDGKTDLKDIILLAIPHAKTYEEKLADKGLILSQRFSLQVFLIATIMVGLFALGFAKFCVGISQDKPIIFLVLMMFVTLGLLIFFLHRRYRTAYGNTMMEKIRVKGTALKSIKDWYTPETSGNQLALAVSVFGLMILENSPFDLFYNAVRGDIVWRTKYPNQTPFYISNGGGCGGGGCGGGGCGGGGCGGCGD